MGKLIKLMKSAKTVHCRMVLELCDPGETQVQCALFRHATDYGHPESFFFKNLELLGLSRHFDLKFFEAFGVFSAGLSAVIDFYCRCLEILCQILHRVA